MTLLHRFASVLRWIFYRHSVEQDLDDELKSFVEMAAADGMRAGATDVEARRSAVLELGGLEQVKEGIRSTRHGAWLDEIWRDVRFSLRLCIRQFRFMALVVLTLAFGIAGVTVMFAFIDGVLLRPLPVREQGRLIVA